ncbi:MAG: HAD family hydrolase [Planctomycetia bacterium]|nr:HAD family hydrolase [Planctomycetia bacterium]
MNSKRAIFLDRDGTLTRDLGFVHRAEDLRLLDNAVAGLRRMSAAGFRLFITTNQSGIARGYFSEADMHAFNAALQQQLRAEGVEIEAIYFCPFHPEGRVAAYRRDSPLRKPRPGMILQAAAEHRLDLNASFAIGDKKSDILAGQAAGCSTILIRTGAAGAGENELQANADFVAPDLLAAAEWIDGEGSMP